jgi:glyoxylase-like metal-dependent hydrolase (beta-lactamase superfamily II)
MRHFPLASPARRAILAAATLATCALIASCANTASSAVDPKELIAQTERAMGSSQLTTLRYSATGNGGVYGQAYTAGQPWPKTTISVFTREINYAQASMRETMARSRAEPNGGGAIPLMGQGEQRTVFMVSGDRAWNMVGPAPTAAPVGLEQRQHDLWTTPHGVLKAAAKAGQVNAQKGMLEFQIPGQLKAKVMLDANGLVERVESVAHNPVAGDVSVVTRYSDYADFGGLKFPRSIVQTQGGHMVYELKVSEVQAGAEANFPVPELVNQFAERATSQQAAPGVWFVAGGSHNSVAIEMADHVVVVESPLYDARANAMLDEVKRIIPGKPVRFVVNSHHHFDHSGGLRAAAAQGATIISSELSRAYFAQTLAQASTLKPDALARSGRSVRVEGVSGGKRVISDATRTVEIYEIAEGVHANGFLMVYLPQEKMLIQADAYTPLAVGAAPPAVPNGNNVNLVQNIERLKLDVQTLLPLHGRIVPIADLYAAAGRSR